MCRRSTAAVATNPVDHDGRWLAQPARSTQLSRHGTSSRGESWCRSRRAPYRAWRYHAGGHRPSVSRLLTPPCLRCEQVQGRRAVHLCEPVRGYVGVSVDSSPPLDGAQMEEAGHRRRVGPSIAAHDEAEVDRARVKVRRHNDVAGLDLVHELLEHRCNSLVIHASTGQGDAGGDFSSAECTRIGDERVAQRNHPSADALREGLATFAGPHQPRTTGAGRRRPTITTPTCLAAHAASARRRTSSAAAIRRSTSLESNSASGPCGLRSVNGDS
jgi:hypothetical protein